MTALINRPNLRCRILAWMRESVWAWYMPMTDWMDNLMPSTLSPVVADYHAVAFGFNQLDNEHNGPN